MLYFPLIEAVINYHPASLKSTRYHPPIKINVTLSPRFLRFHYRSLDNAVIPNNNALAYDSNDFSSPELRKNW